MKSSLKFITPKSLVLIFLGVFLVVAVSTYFELRHSRAEINGLMREQSGAMLEALVTASENSLATTESVEQAMLQKLLVSAGIVRTLYNNGSLNDVLLTDIINNSGLVSISVYDRTGKRVNTAPYDAYSYYDDSPESLAPIFNGTADTLLIGNKPPRANEEPRYALALSAKNNSAVVVNISAEEPAALRRSAGFGPLLKDIAENKNIIYAALQDTSYILAAAGNTSLLEDINGNTFLTEAYIDDNLYYRTFDRDTVSVFEAVYPFDYDSLRIGIFRLGLSAEPINSIDSRVIRRSATVGGLLVLAGFVIIVYIFSRQNMGLLEKKYKAVESYSERIIENVGDPVVVTDPAGLVLSVNSAAETIGLVTGNNINIITGSDSPSALAANAGLTERECKVNNKSCYLLISAGEFLNENENKNYVFVLRDYTELRELKEKIERQERLSAMGELAGGVAHEIRNPLNSIGIIVQQLDKDFEPKENNEEYHSLAGTVYREVKRINETVNNFLKFAAPGKLTRSAFSLKDLLDEIALLYAVPLREKGLSLDISTCSEANVYWDRDRIKEVFINLFENAIQASGSNGKITVTCTVENEAVKMVVEDNGAGIPPDVLPKIFNLYFTTRPEGTGIGLAAVQKIIYEHDGTVTAESEPGKGTAFTIKIPDGKSINKPD